MAGDADHGHRSLAVGVAGNEQLVRSGAAFISTFLCRHCGQRGALETGRVADGRERSL